MRLANVVIIWNPMSGTANEERIDRLEAALQKGRSKVKVLQTTPERHSAVRLSRQACLERPDLIIVVSGDSMIGQVGMGTRSTKTPMGIIAGGTANAFIRGFYGDKSPEETVEMFRRIPEESIRSVDAIRVSYCGGGVHQEDLAVVEVGFGKVAEAIARADQAGKRKAGSSYVSEFMLRASQLDQPRHFKLTAWEPQPPAMWSALWAVNSCGPGFAKVFPNSNAFDGRMDIIAFEEMSQEIFQNFGKIVSQGRPEKSGPHHQIRQRECYVGCGERFCPEVDGELGLETDMVHLLTLPGALRIVLG